MIQNVLEKLGVKLINTLLLVFVFIALLGSFFFVPHLTTLNSNTLYFVLIEIIGVFFFICMIKLFYTFVLKLPPKYDLLFTVVCLAFITIIQFLVVKYFEIRPLDDLNKVTNMAIDLVNNGKFTSDNSYFSMYTNNIPLTIYLSQYYKILIHFGFGNYTMAGSLLGVLCINASIIITSLILKELRDRKSAVFFIAFNVFNPLIYLWGTFYYTTIIALPFMMLGIYLIVKLQKETKFVNFCFEIFLFAIVLYIGTQIRATTSFVMIGAIVLFLMKIPNYKIERTKILLHAKKLLCGMAVFFLGLLLISSCYHSMLDPTMEADYSQTSFPATHWIMMGLKDNGGFDWADEQETLIRSTREDKIKFNKEQIRSRIQDMGIRGMGELIVNKLIYTWSDGSHDYPVTMRASHNFTSLHKYITGEKNDPFIIYCQIFNITILLFFFIQMVKLFRNNITPKSLLIYIILLGGFLFHLLWEANPKYSLNFILLVMFIDMEAISDLFQAEHLSHSFSKAVTVLGNIFIMLTLVISFILFPHFTKESMSFHDLVQGQFVSNKDRISDINQGSYLQQSFYTGRAFNNIEIQVYNDSSSRDAIYKLQILDENQTILYTTEFSPNEKSIVELIDFNFKTIVPQKASTYYIEISSDGVDPKDTIIFCMSNKQGYDVFPHGNLFIDDQEIAGDIAFSVSEITKKPYTNSILYVLFIGSILLFECLMFYYYKKQAQQLAAHSESLIL
jgi:hypothetical protein